MSDTADIIAADLEGTLTGGATWSGMRAYLEVNGQKRRFQQFIHRYMWPVLKFRLGLIKDEWAFKEQWVLDLFRLFAGYTAAELETVAEFVVENELWPQRRQAVVDEFLAQQADGRRLLIVTGVIEPVLAKFAQKAGNVEAIGTPLTFADGVFTGEVAAPLNTGESKVEQLRPFTPNGQIKTAYGDTAADIPMLQMAANPVAVFPDKVLQDTAVAHQWRIIE
ncbi:MAG: HAD-IB family phosphatase [Chloroflexi bacterium]|nr:HAD-IB family phosphatase [Chloroflexota bacterium]